MYFVVCAIVFFAFLPLFGAAGGLAMLWYAFRGAKTREKALWCGAAFACVSAIELSWMTSTEYQGVYIIFVWIFLSLFLGFQCSILSALHTGKAKDYLILPALWVFFEYMRLWPLCGMAFCPLGGLLGHNLYARQCAAIGGQEFLSFLVVFANVGFSRAIAEPTRKRAFAAVLACALPYLMGATWLSLSQEKHEKTLRCLLVQTGLSPAQKLGIGNASAFIPVAEQWDRIYQALHPYFGQKIDLVVLPEGAVPGLFWQRNLSALAASCNAPVIGGFEELRPDGKLYACAIAQSPDALSYVSYAKRILLPIAEKIPFEFLRPLAAWYGIADSFGEGTTRTIFYDPVPIAPSICYEELLSDEVRRGAWPHAKLLVNITNDAWYPKSSLSLRHFEQARLRSVELGLVALRTCNSGVTAAIDVRGRTLASWDREDAHVLDVTVPITKVQTPFAYVGPHPLRIWSIVVCGLFLLQTTLIQYTREHKWCRKS